MDKQPDRLFPWTGCEGSGVTITRWCPECDKLRPFLRIGSWSAECKACGEIIETGDGKP